MQEEPSLKVEGGKGGCVVGAPEEMGAGKSNKPEQKELRVMSGTGTKWKSFKHLVTKENGEVMEEEDWWCDGRWKERISVRMTKQDLDVIRPQEEKECLAKKWEEALIVKLHVHRRAV